jgi:hypothetical protein
MAIIQSYPEELDYVNACMHPTAAHGSFLDAFLQACISADSENYELLRPVLRALIVKYPAPPERLEGERRDRGAA